MNLRLLPFRVFLVCALLIPSLVNADEQAVQRDLEVRRERLETIEQRLRAERKKGRDLAKEKESVLAELSRLDARIMEQWGLVDSLRRELTNRELRIERMQNEMRVSTDELEKRKRLVETRLRAFSRMGPLGILNILFSAEGLHELLAREEYLRLILARDSELRNGYVREIAEISARQAGLVEEGNALKETARKLEAETLLLEKRKTERKTFYEGLLAEEQRLQRTIRELQVAKRSIQDVVEDLRLVDEASRGLSASFVSVDRFRDQKGRLTPPLPGGEILSNGRTPIHKKSSGIAIRAPMGSEVRAIFDGIVVYQGELEGYGNVVIIDHGDLYYSLTAQVMKSFAKVGQQVVEGDVIGLSGGGAWVPEGIYLEIRQEGRQEDPRKWIDLRGMEPFVGKGKNT